MRALVVVHGVRVGVAADARAVALGERLERADPLVERAHAAQPVDRLAPRGRGQPRRRDGRHAVARPAGQRDGVGVLQGVLGQLELAAEMADEGREHPRAVLADGPLERGGGVRQSKVWTGRTSTVP